MSREFIERRTWVEPEGWNEPHWSQDPSSAKFKSEKRRIDTAELEMACSEWLKSESGKNDAENCRSEPIDSVEEFARWRKRLKDLEDAATHATAERLNLEREFSKRSE